MSLTSIVNREAHPADIAGTFPVRLISMIRAVFLHGLAWLQPSDQVAGAISSGLHYPATLLPASLLRRHLPPRQQHPPRVHPSPGPVTAPRAPARHSSPRPAGFMPCPWASFPARLRHGSDASDIDGAAMSLSLSRQRCPMAVALLR